MAEERTGGVLIGFLGDVHGRVFHALAAALEWQRRSGRRFDLLIQVGDLGAFPDPARLDEATQRYAQLEPAELDFRRLLVADGELEDALRTARSLIGTPVLFIRGNHEDFGWLAETCGSRDVACVDAFDLLHHVRDGSVLDFGGTRVAFLGGVEAGAQEELIDEAAYRKLLDEPPGGIDLLVTHDPPHGVATGYYGQTQGSAKITRLIERLQPKHHVAGHLHHMIGPRQYGPTTYIGLASLFPTAGRGHPAVVQPGSLAVLDTDAGGIDFVTDGWLGEIGAEFSLVDYVRGL